MKAIIFILLMTFIVAGCDWFITYSGSEDHVKWELKWKQGLKCEYTTEKQQDDPPNSKTEWLVDDKEDEIEQKKKLACP